MNFTKIIQRTALWSITVTAWMALIFTTMLFTYTAYFLATYNAEVKKCVQADNVVKSEQYCGFFGDDCQMVSRKYKCESELKDRVGAAGMLFHLGILLLIPTLFINSVTVIGWRAHNHQLNPTV